MKKIAILTTSLVFIISLAGCSAAERAYTEITNPEDFSSNTTVTVNNNLTFASGINWLGELAGPPITANVSDAYFDQSDNNSYVWNGSSWDMLAAHGADGAAGGAEVDPVYSAAPAAGITAGDITKWNDTTSNLTAHEANTSNPHNVTAAQVAALPTANVTAVPTAGLVLVTDANKTYDSAISRGISYQTVSWNGTLIAENNTLHFTIPVAFNGMNIVAVQFHVYTVSSGGTPTYELYNATQGWKILSTALTIDVNEKDSKDATTAAVINTSYDAVATGDEITGGCTEAGTGTKGGDVIITFRMP